MWQVILDSLLNFFRNIGEFANWLTTPIEDLGIPPIAFVTLGGFAVIFAIWLVKLINPLS